MNKENHIPIIYENQEIIIINKRAGLAVQGGKNIVHSIDSLLKEQFGKPLYLVHRLDKETSGLLIVAKTKKAAAKWTTLISSKQVKKEYKAFCFGCPKKNYGTISTQIEEQGTKKNALTYYEVISNLNLNVTSFPSNASTDSVTSLDISLLHLTLGTGRTHQIRLHLASEGFPIIGDEKHGNFLLNKIVKKQFRIKHLMLCAYRLTIPLDLSGNRSARTFEIPLPEYMKDTLFKL